MIAKRLAAHKLMLLLRSNPAAPAAIFEEESIDINYKNDQQGEERFTSSFDHNEYKLFPLLRCKEQKGRRRIRRELLGGEKSTITRCERTRKHQINLKSNSRVDQSNCTTSNIIMTVLSIQIFILFFFISFKSNGE